MKLKELLLELRELLNRNEYGAWIDPQNKVHPVASAGHQLFVEEYLVDQGYDINQIQELGPDQIYNIAFKLGFIRTMHHVVDKTGVVIQIEGNGKALKRAATVLWPTATQPDIQMININKVVSGVGHTNFKPFSIPSDLKALRTFLEAG